MLHFPLLCIYGMLLGILDACWPRRQELGTGPSMKLAAEGVPRVSSRLKNHVASGIFNIILSSAKAHGVPRAHAEIAD